MIKIKKFESFNNKREYTIFCDMDGVLTDFNGNFIKINSDGLSPDLYEEKYGKQALWDLIELQGIKWWSDMPWISGGKELWNYINKNNDVIICSSPSRSPLSALGKIEWIKRELGIEQEFPTRSPKYNKWDENSRIILASQKYLFANRFQKSILIDDTAKQINNWINAGGIGILYDGDVEKTISILENKK
jgi:hypothetical protein